MTKKRPTVARDLTGANLVAYFERNTFKLFYMGNAHIKFVLGEFYWLVKAGQTVEMRDFINPPYMSSSEQDGKEIVWSMSEFMPAAEIRKAFNIEPMRMPMPMGIAPNQPAYWSGHWKNVKYLWLMFVVVLTAIQMVHASSAANKVVLDQNVLFSANGKSKDTITTSVFKVEKDKANLRIDLRADVDNSWLWMQGELVNDNTGETYPFESTSEYYHGIEDGEGWSEGAAYVQHMLSSVPAGNYYINFDYESGDFKTPGMHNFDLSVVRDVPTYASYFWCLFFISCAPMLVYLSSRTEESTRWSQSDFNPYAKTWSTGDF